MINQPNKTFKQLERNSVRNYIYKAVRDAIFSGKLLPGQKLTENSLANDFNVSRVVVREALQQLAYKGLVVQNPYKGTNVVRLSSKEVDEIISIRVLLESEAIREAKVKLSKTDKAMLQKIVAELDTMEHTFRHTELDFQLHQKIWEISGNETLRKLLIHVSAPFFAMGVIVRQSKKNYDYSQVGKHHKVIDALIDGSTDDAVKVMREHIEQNRQIIGKKFDDFVETNTDSS